MRKVLVSISVHFVISYALKSSRHSPSAVSSEIYALNSSRHSHEDQIINSVIACSHDAGSPSAGEVS